MGREKKYIQAVLAAAVMVALIGTVSVRAEDTGAYASVKAVFGYTVMNSMRAKGNASYGDTNYSGSIGSGSGEDAVFGGSAALGYDFFRKFCVPVRAEVEYSIFTRASDSNSDLNINGNSTSTSAKEKLKVNAQTVFVNAYYDFHNQSRFTPYLGAGAGMAFVRSKGSIDIGNINIGTLEWNGGSFATGGHTKTNFAYNATAGVSYALTKSIDLDLAYRFADLGKARSSASDIDGNGSYNNQAKHIYMHQVQLGVRFSF